MSDDKDSKITDQRYYSLFPKALSGCIEHLTRPLLKSQGLAGTKVLTEWASIVGPQLSRRTMPEKLSFPKGKKTGGTLTIAVENGFATELQHMQPLIIERLAGYFGYQAVTRISLSPTWLPMGFEKPQPPAAKPVLPADCRSLTEEVKDPELREALDSLAKTLSGELA